MSSLLNEINQTLRDTELNKDGELDRLVDFLDSSENDVNDVNDVNDKNNNMVGGATLNKGNYMAVNESIFKNIHPYYYKLFKNFNMADMKDAESTEAQTDANYAHTEITAAKASIYTLAVIIDEICTRFNTFLTEAFINHLNRLKPILIAGYVPTNARDAIRAFTASKTNAIESIAASNTALIRAKTAIDKALTSSRKLINDINDGVITTRYRLAKEAQKSIDKIQQYMDYLKPKIEADVEDLYDNCIKKIKDVTAPYNGEAEQEAEHVNAKKIIQKIRVLTFSIARLINETDEKAKELKEEEAVKIQGLGEFDKDHKTLEYEVYKTLVNEDANYKEILAKLELSSGNWFCRTCKGNITHTSSFNFKEEDYYGNYAIMSDAKNETKCHFCGTKLDLKDKNLETPYKRFFLPSLLAKSIECPLVLDKNFLNYAYYHNVRETTRHYNDALKDLLRKKKYFFDIGYFELKSEEAAFIHYEYIYKHKDEEFKAGDGTFSKNAHFINNMSINIAKIGNVENYDTMNDAKIDDILFIIPKHSINTYFETVAKIDLRLVLLFDKKSEKNTTPIKLSKNLRFALLNIKKQYKKYKIKKTKIDTIWKTGIDTEITKAYVKQFCDDKRQKLFKENNERIIFKMKNSNGADTDYKAVDSGMIQKNLMGNYSENIAHKDTSYIKDEHKALVGIISLLVKQNITDLFESYKPTALTYDKVYRLNDIYKYIEGEYLYKILEKMKKNTIDDKETFEFHDTAIISSKLFKDILNNYLLEKYKTNISDKNHTKLKDKSDNTARKIGCTETAIDFEKKSISEYILLNRKDTLLENEIFPDYPFFYHLLDEGMPSLCITTNEHKVVPISDNLLYRSLKDKHTFRCNEGGLHMQIKEQFENLDKIINHTPTPPPNAYSFTPS